MKFRSLLENALLFCSMLYVCRSIKGTLGMECVMNRSSGCESGLDDCDNVGEIGICGWEEIA